MVHIFIMCPAATISMAVTYTFIRVVNVTGVVGQTYIKLKFQKAQTGAKRFEYSAWEHKQKTNCFTSLTNSLGFFIS